MKTTVITPENQSVKASDKVSNRAVNVEKVSSANGLPLSKSFDQDQPEVKKVDALKTGVKPVEQVVAPVEIAHKPALNLEETLKLVAELAKKTAQRDRYNGYIDMLKAFVVSQNDDDDMAPNDTSFKGCELMIKDGQGHVFRTDSAAVISGTIDFMAGRFNERLAEVEAEIVIPA